MHWLRIICLCWWATGCGPAVAPYGGTEAGTGSGGNASNGSTAATGATDEPLETGGPRLDAGGPSTPTTLCGQPVPRDCDPGWPSEAGLDLDPWASNVRPAGTDWIDVDLAASTSGDPERLWSLAFPLACWELPRVSVVASLTVREHAGFEYTHVGTYRADVDVELLNTCAHLQIHAIEVHPEPEESGAPAFAWPELVGEGFAYARIQPSD